jgi:hypothetical protein
VNRKSARRIVAVFLSGVGAAQPSSADPVPLAAVRPKKPAVQLVGVREAAAPAVVARGVSSGPGQPFDPFFDPTAPARADTAVSGLPGGFPINATFDPRTQQPNGRGVWGTITTWTNDRAKAVRTALGEPQQPPPRVGQLPPGQPMVVGPPVVGQPVMVGAPIQGYAPTGRAAYAGNPAYRWYGWGTTTPGANAYAPAGDYPPASAQWHAMTGATPGAFPVPVTNPFRPEPGAEPPGYAARPAPPKAAPAVPPPAVAVADAPLPSPPTATPIAETPPFRYVPPDELPVHTSVAPVVPAAGPDWRSPVGPISAKPTAEPKLAPPADETTWQPVSYTEPAATAATATGGAMVGQSVPSADRPAGGKLLEASAKATKELSPAERVRLACGPGVSAVEVKKLGAENVIVRFNAASDAVAERAAKAISELAELKPYTVTFDVVIGK